MPRPTPRPASTTAPAFALAVGFAPATAPIEEPPAVLDARFGERRSSVSTASLLADGLPSGKAFGAVYAPASDGTGRGSVGAPHAAGAEPR